jgi:serine protease Do
MPDHAILIVADSTTTEPLRSTVNRTLALQLFAGADPIGAHLIRGREKEDVLEIVGVAADTKMRTLGEAAARNVMDQLQRGGKVRRGKLGVGIQEITSDLAKSLGLRDARGVLVNSVDPDGPAERAGIRTGDIITAVNGIRVNDANTLRNHIAGTAPDTEITVQIQRDGREQEVHARLSELPTDKAAAASSGGSESRREQLGITVEPLTSDTATRLALRRGTQGVVVTEVDPTGPAAEAGIEPDDVILQVNREPVKSAAELRAAVGRSAGRPALLLLSRGGRSLFLAVQPR